MILHHPADDLLLAVAAGRLSPGPALLLDVHLAGCAACRARLRLLNAIGGALVDEAPPQPLAADAWEQTLRRIEQPHGAAASATPPAAASVAGRLLATLRLPAGLHLPPSLRACTTGGWRWMGPGMHYARLHSPQDPAAKLFLLRIGEGRSLPRHTHHDVELTQVLYGSFDDGRAAFGAGDFDAADDSVHHQPIVASGGECICLAHVAGGLRFDGRVARLVGGWIGM